MIGVGTCKISPLAKKYVNQVLDSNRLSYGPFTQKFERKFAANHQSRFAVMTNSGTCSLLIALAVLKNKYQWSDGDEVIVPAVTFIATSNVVLQLNMKPIFVDIDPIYYEIDPSKIEEKITSKTICIIPVHLFGLPCDMDPIMDIAKKHNLRVIEDSCETMFAKYKGKSVGSFGDINCFSTYVAHILTTGIGGICTTSDIGLATDLRSLINHGRDSIYISIDDDKDKSLEESKMIIKRRFSFVQMGYSFRVTEMEGAIGLAELEDHETMMNQRRSNAEFLTKNLSNLSKFIQLPAIRPDATHSYMMYPIVLKNEKKDNFVNYLEQNGVETRDMLPLTNQPFYKEQLGIIENDYPNAKWINDNGFYIASHHGLSNSEKNHIVETFNNYFNKSTQTNELCALIVMSKFDQQIDDIYIANYLDSIPYSIFDELWLVDASSNFNKADQFIEKGFSIKKASPNKGKELLNVLQEIKSSNIILIGIDGSEEMEDLIKIKIELQKGKELVIASRFMSGCVRETDRPLSYRSVGNRFFSFLISVIINKSVTDCNNLYRGFKKDSILKLGLEDKKDNIMFEMTYKALQKGLSFFEVSTNEKKSQIKRNRQNRIKSAINFLLIILKNNFTKR